VHGHGWHHDQASAPSKPATGSANGQQSQQKVMIACMHIRADWLSRTDVRSSAWPCCTTLFLITLGAQLYNNLCIGAACTQSAAAAPRHRSVTVHCQCHHACYQLIYHVVACLCHWQGNPTPASSWLWILRSRVLSEGAVPRLPGHHSPHELTIEALDHLTNCHMNIADTVRLLDAHRAHCLSA
jgi:hypothetical protein